MTTRSRSLTLSSSEELGSESRISNVTSCKCPKKNCTIKSWERPWRSEEPKTSIPTKWTTSSAESAGAMKMTTKTHLSLHANARVLSVLSISNAWRVGSLLKNKKNHQVLRTRTWGPFTGKGLNAKFASKCILTLSRSGRLSTKLSIKQTKLQLRRMETTFFLSQCLSTKTPLGTFICWLLLLSRPNSNWEEAMRVKSGSTIFQLVGATQLSNVSKMDSILKIILQSSEPLSYSKTSWG